MNDPIGLLLAAIVLFRLFRSLILLADRTKIDKIEKSPKNLLTFNRDVLLFDCREQ